MLRLIAGRACYAALTLLAASIVLFLLFEVSAGDVATDVLGAFTTPEQRHIWLLQNGYLDPAPLRYLRWLGGFLTGDMGQSRIFDMPVATLVLQRLGNTAILALLFFACLVPLSLGLGVLAGMREGSVADRVVSSLCVMTTSIPPFASTVLVSAVLVFWLGLLPGTSSMIDGFDLRQLVMPVLVLLIYDVGYVARITRASMAEVMNTPYMRAARLKGMPAHRVVLRHALRNALIAPFTVLMLQVNWLVAGVIVVEFFFSYKGFGALILEASLGHDFYLLEACTMVTVLIAVATQTVADIGYAYLNPRMKR
jgi:peptide/nickel transport system permease protein